MTFAFWCVLIAGVLPYVWTGVAKIGGRDYSNRTPRLYLQQLEGYRQRADWAQANAFEAFAFFAAGVIIAHLAGAPQDWINALAGVFVVARVLHGIAYVTDQHLLRSLLWMAGFFSVVGLFIISA